MSLCPINVNMVDYLGWFVGVVRSREQSSTLPSYNMGSGYENRCNV